MRGAFGKFDGDPPPRCDSLKRSRRRADAKAKGVKFGRKPVLTPHQQQEARKRLEAGETQRSVARSYNVSQSTISRRRLGGGDTGRSPFNPEKNRDHPLCASAQDS